MNKNPLNLNKLTVDDIDFSKLPEITERLDRIERECREKYGDDWWEPFVAATNPSHDIDLDEASVNRAIFGGYRLFITSNPSAMMRREKLYWDKLKRLFGPFYKRYVKHKINDPRVNKALIKDALKSGKWKELPKELQDEYHRLAGK